MAEERPAAVNLSNLVDTLYERNPGLGKGQVRRSVQLIHNSIVGALSREDRVEIRGFGTFFLSLRPAHRFHNPRTGEQVVIPPRRIPRFKAGKNLRKTVDAGEADGS